MCVKIPCISLILCVIQLNHAFRISATNSRNQQVLQLPLGSDLTLFTFYNLTDAAVGPCNGTCVALNTRYTERIDGENCKVDLENGIPEINVIIETVVSNSFVGIWSCTLRTPSAYRPETMSLQSAVFRVFVTPTGSTAEIPKRPKTPSGSVVSVVVPVNGTKDVTLKGGESLELNIKGNFSPNSDKTYACNTQCNIVSHGTIEFDSCSVQDTHSILAVKENAPAYYGLWNCTVNLNPIKQENSREQDPDHVQKSIQFRLSISDTTIAVIELTNEKIIIIAIAVSTIVALVIVGQAICIIHFKKKAKRAQIVKNLTPKNTINEGSSPERYVNKKGKEESGKGVDEGIYEVLGSARDEPPPLPPLATIPGTPKHQHLMRSASQSNLLDGASFSTAPRPPRSHQSPGRFNTVARSSSLERIKKRPPQPLPTDSDIYEDVAPDGISPMIKRNFLGKKSTPPGPTTPMSPNRLVPTKPLPSLPSKAEFLKPPGSNVGRPPITKKFPAGAKPMAGMAMLPTVTSGPGGLPMGGMPLLPSMISPANLKPVKPKPSPPVAERPRHHQTLPTPPSTSAKTYKPKPPVPLPQPVREEPEPIPEDFESVVSDDSDEFENYDVLPDCHIYGNGAY